MNRGYPADVGGVPSSCLIVLSLRYFVDFTISLIFFQVQIMVVGHTLKDFCENTSVHGLVFVVDSKSSLLKRLAWMTIFLVSLSYAIMQIKESIDGRLRNQCVTYILP